MINVASNDFKIEVRVSLCVGFLLWPNKAPKIKFQYKKWNEFANFKELALALVQFQKKAALEAR